MKIANRRQFLAMTVGVAAAPLAAKMANAGGHLIHEVEIKGGRFSPATLEMVAGDQVRFTNLDAAPHTATDEGGAFDSGTLRRGDSATIKIENAGSYNYFCAVHPSMKGKIVAA